MGRNKDLRKHIQGEIKQIHLHLDKIAAEKEKPYPDRRGIEKWEQDIARHLRTLEKLRNRLPGRKK
jgi:Tfp pilus assembly protein PilN